MGSAYWDEACVWQVEAELSFLEQDILEKFRNQAS